MEPKSVKGALKTSTAVFSGDPEWSDVNFLQRNLVQWVLEAYPFMSFMAVKFCVFTTLLPTDTLPPKGE